MKKKEKDIMQKLKVALLALALVGMTTSAVNAAGQAWFSLEGVVQGSASATSGPGQTLVITKPQGPGVTILTIGYNVTTDFGPMTAWSITLSGPADVSAGGLAWPGTGYTSPGFDVGSAGAGANLLTDFGQTSFNATGSQGLVGTFQLTITKGPNGLRQIFGTFGNGSQGDSSAYGAWTGYVGANPNPTQGSNFYGFNGYDAATAAPRPSLPIIEINNIPEPATIVLLGLGAVALVRRRRA